MRHCERYSTILALEEKDAAELARLESACFSTPWTEEQYKRILAEAPGGSAPVFGIRAARGELVAYLALGVHHTAGELEVYNIAVDPAHRRRGLAARLLSSALGAAARRGVRTAFLEVRAGNAAALALYGSQGFVRCGIRKGYYANTGEDALVLSCDLAARFSGRESGL